MRTLYFAGLRPGYGSEWWAYADPGDLGSSERQQVGQPLQPAPANVQYNPTAVPV